LSATRPPSKSSLPAQPSLDHLRKLAKRRLANLRSSGADIQLADAQLLVAREYGFPSWRALKAALDCGATQDCGPPPNRFQTASRYWSKLDRVGLEHAFFNFMVIGLFLTCMAMTFDFHVPQPVHTSAPVVVDVEILR
jgi:hypothetical protein